MSVKQLSVFAENKNGSLWEITKILSDAEIAIRAFSVADTQSFGILRLIVNDPRRAALALSESGKIVNVNEVIGVEIPDTNGGLSDLLRVTTENNIALEYLYAFVAEKSEHAHVVLRVADNAKTEEILTSAGFTMLEDKDIV